MIAFAWFTATEVAIAGVLAVAVVWLIRELVRLGERVSRLEGRLNGAPSGRHE